MKMVSCVVCNVTVNERRCKNLKDCKRGKDFKDSLLDLILELLSSTVAKSKNGLKLTSEYACLPCFRELNSFSELQLIFHNKQSEILRKLNENKPQVTKNGRKKPSQDNRDVAKILALVREPFVALHPPPALPVSIQAAVQEDIAGLSLESILSMDAEITITAEENGGAEIDFEVVEGISDLKRESGLYGCRFCKREFITADFAINHMREVHGKLLHKCETCGQEFRLKSEIDDHKVSHLKDGPMPFQCGSCPRGFQNFEAFQEHNKLHHMKKRFGCGQCGRKYDDENKLTQHMANHQIKPFSCNKCNKLFRSNNACLRHQKLHGDSARYCCNLCLKTFSSAENLHAHLKNHNKPFRCDLCNKGFDTHELLEKHNESHGGKQKRNVECKVCGKLFITSVQLESHMRVHTGEKPYQCDACGATFSQRSNLDSHHRAVHLQERRFRCSICDKSFKRRRLLQYHIKSVHTGERPYVCEVCNASFVYPEHYKKHLLTHSGIKPWACEICGKTFSSKDNRNAHRFTHSDRKPYECQVCGMSFMRKPALLHHLQEQGHGDPETAGAAVKIVQVLTGHEMESEAPVEWAGLEVQNPQSLPLSFSGQEMMQTLVIPDANGRPIEIQVISSDDTGALAITPDSAAADQLQFELTAESLNVIQAFELQGGNVDDTLAALI